MLRETHVQSVVGVRVGDVKGDAQLAVFGRGPTGVVPLEIV